MESFPANELAYVLFVVPGFMVVWTYRHFTRAKEINGFEYAIWSFLWGILLFLGLSWFIIRWGSFPNVSINNVAELLASLTSMGLAFALVAAPPLGYLGAMVAKLGLFQWADKWLFKFIKWYSD